MFRSWVDDEGAPRERGLRHHKPLKEVSIIAEPQTITTSRLLLRPPATADARSIFEGYAQDADVTRYLVWEPHPTMEHTKRFLDECQRGWDSGKSLSWAIVLKKTGKMMGMIGARPRGFKANIGFVLARPHWNRGYMTEAAGAVVERLLSDAGCYRVWAVCDVDNGASARVLEKIGMTREGILRRWVMHPNISAEPRDALMYAKVR